MYVRRRNAVMDDRQVSASGEKESLPWHMKSQGRLGGLDCRLFVRRLAGGAGGQHCAAVMFPMPVSVAGQPAPGSCQHTHDSGSAGRNAGGGCYD